MKIGPKFDEMDVELAALSKLREKPAGTIRITATEYVAEAILMVGPDLRMAVVGAPSYFTIRKKPRTPHDLTQHNVALIFAG